ncbi:RnfABCDGE type electron transport complex subunit B [Snodgrassella gandavensis]|uniref:RnfABCDGE type electron transport complex subunit B n=1 Tax=Snodgrassella gandavensis TaxID=2946698 RepID=UPI001EF58DE0|nr:RnfABCDGE type electron transport complex subunit B [Snodgrassella gandavensis]
MSIASEHIDRLLPQTQCRQCGYQGCSPYAQALSRGEAAINLCTPGGVTVIRDLAQLLNVPVQPPADLLKAEQPKAIAVIDEAECIGCTACIKACPVDAILGATKQMHTVISNECSGCELCIEPCPVDCISMQPVPEHWLPRARQLAENLQDERFAAATQANARFQHRTARLQRLQREKEQQLHARQQKTAITATPATKSASSIDPAALIAKAMAKAQTQQLQRRVPDNQDSFQQQQIAKAQEQASYRRAMRDLQYGSEQQKADALAWLRLYKQQRESQQ